MTGHLSAGACAPAFVAVREADRPRRCACCSDCRHTLYVTWLQWHPFALRSNCGVPPVQGISVEGPGCGPLTEQRRMAMAVKVFDMAASTVALTTWCVLRRDSAGGDRTAPLCENANGIAHHQLYPPLSRARRLPGTQDRTLAQFWTAQS